jgi:hypothetical protein
VLTLALGTAQDGTSADIAVFDRTARAALQTRLDATATTHHGERAVNGSALAARVDTLLAVRG